MKDFATEEACIDQFEKIRWPNRLARIRCGAERISKFDAKGKTSKVRHLYKCMNSSYPTRRLPTPSFKIRTFR
jgi:hypothetical protein